MADKSGGASVHTVEARQPVFADENDVRAAAEQTPYRPCDQLRYDLKMCLLNTDCVKNGKTPRQCLHENDPSIPEDCLKLKNRFFECKRSLVGLLSRCH
jgi:hypothetical protein